MALGVVYQSEITPPYCSAIQHIKNDLMSEVEMVKPESVVCGKNAEIEEIRADLSNNP